MSMILKGIDLPPNAKVQIIVESPAESFRKQIPKSKVIQIPKGHGDIIDRNDIYIGRWDIDTDLAEQLLNAPIILESERNNESNT
jgi:hypothetical protein